MDRRFAVAAIVIVVLVTVLAASANAGRSPSGPRPGGHWGIWALRLGR